MNSLLWISLYSFRTKLLAANRLITQERTKLDIEQKSSTFLFEIMTQLSAVNNTDPDMEFILWGRSFIILRTIKSLQLMFREIHVLMYCRHRKKISWIRWCYFNFVFYFLHSTWNNLQLHVEFHRILNELIKFYELHNQKPWPNQKIPHTCNCLVNRF